MEKEIEKLEEYKVWEKFQNKDNATRDKILNNLIDKLLPYYQKKLTDNWFKEEDIIWYIKKVYSIEIESKKTIENSLICLDCTVFKMNTDKDIRFLYTENYEKKRMYLFEINELTKIDIEEINRIQDSILRFIQNSLDLYKTNETK